MASTTVPAPVPVAPAFTVDDLAERGIHAASRVGSCVEARRFGTILEVVSDDDILVIFDDGESVWVSWTAVAPLGTVATL